MFEAAPGRFTELQIRRLRAIRERVDELSELEDVTEERPRADWILRAAVERVLTFAAAAEAGVISKDLTDKVAPASGLRKILVHQYLDADLGIVADAVGHAVPDFAEYVRQVAGWLASQKASHPAGPEAASDS